MGKEFNDLMNNEHQGKIAKGTLTNHEKHGDVVSTGFGGSRWYEFEDGTIKTYLDLLMEDEKK